MTKINGNVDLISRLPTEVLQLILLNLNLRDLRTCERISCLFKQQVRDEALWRQKIKEYHIVCSCNSSARLAAIRFFRPKPMPKPVPERQIFPYTFREDWMI
jgi:hypothetical protein